MNNELKLSLIERYRETIKERYRFEKIKDDKQLPSFFTQEVLDELRDFFLDNLYPDEKRRKTLDASFKRLASYINNPLKIWGILGSLTSAIFTFGTLFPKAVFAGIETLHTHTIARNFEEMLLAAATQRNLKPPINDSELKQCIANLPEKDILTFVEKLSSLFTMITDTKMLDKTIKILNNVADKMKSQPNTYDKEDVQAILLGVDILERGSVLMLQFSEAEKLELVNFVAYIEMKFVNSVRAEYKS